VTIVSVEDVQKIIGEGGWLVFDARLLKEYDAGHLPGALSFPYAHRDEAFQEWASILNSEQKVLVYCSGKLCDDGLHLAIFLKGMGIKDVALFVDGLDGWKKAGLLVE
jgi:rhodanese-related sulfurtransferase